jgi:hypothetical protein
MREPPFFLITSSVAALGFVWFSRLFPRQSYPCFLFSPALSGANSGANFV